MNPPELPSRIVRSGDALTLWELSPAIETYFPGLARPMPDHVDYRFVNGFTDVGDLPCREAFRETMPGRPIGLPSDLAFDEIRLSDRTTTVDSGGFWHVPTHVRRFARCVVTAAQSGPVRFLLGTCGGARIWVNGQPEARFEPFLRNRSSVTEIELPLSAGANDLVVHFEDLCERDTDWHFELRLLSDVDLSVSLSKAIDAERLSAIERVLDSLRPDKLFYGDEPMHLLVEAPPDRPLPLEISVRSFHRAATESVRRTVTLRPETRRLFLFDARDAATGCCAVEAAVRSGGMRIGRTLGATFLAGLKAGAGGSIADRKREALAHCAASELPGPSRMLALLETGAATERVAWHLADAVGRISRREDCSDFIMVPLLWAWRRHAWTGAPVALWQRVRSSILGWRYWLDEPGDDVMWFWSENHVLCFHVSQYLAGQFFPDEVFVCSGRRGSEQKALARERLTRWFDAVEAHGLVEWNSSAYYPIDFIGLLALLEFADDTALRERARRQLDAIFVMMALHARNGVPGGSMGRVYEKELLAGPAPELAGFAYVAWDEGWLGASGSSLPMFCLSDYRPPPVTRSLVTPPPGATVEASYTQGVDHAGKLRLWKDSAGQLSTVVDHRPGTRGHQQHVVDVLLGGSPHARFWINHPGEERPWGDRRPSYWAGNGRLPRVAQHGPVALLLYRCDGAEDLTWTHLFAPREACDELVREGDWLFARSGDGFAAFHGAAGLTAVKTGLYAGNAWRSDGRRTAWIVAVGGGIGADAFRAFRDRWLASGPVFDPAAMAVSINPPGGPSLRCAFEGPLYVDGRPQDFAPLDPAPHVRLGEGPLLPWQEIVADSHG